ncbi:MAG: hypothetical protein E7370_00775 [Clostridiales bacterium]|nr:hypothetical protein [Clostridiales bacterium]
MNKRNLSILGLEEGATKAEIKQAYEALRAKYLEERFADGEVGNNAAIMLTKIETAYNELINELAEKEGSVGGGEQGASSSAFDHVEELIKMGELVEAQRKLDAFNERGARWHYLQSVLFYKKNWINESKKQLEIAIKIEPDNEKYKEAYRKLVDKINYDANNARNANNAQSDYNENSRQGVYQGQNMSTPEEDQMGGSMCGSCVECCALNACLNCMCNSLCNC